MVRPGRNVRTTRRVLNVLTVRLVLWAVPLDVVRFLLPFDFSLTKLIKMSRRPVRRCLVRLERSGQPPERSCAGGERRGARGAS